MSELHGTLYRGGSSRGLLVHRKELVGIEDAALPGVLAHIMGSPDPTSRQVDGLGGGTSTTSKVVPIEPSADPRWDIEYAFHQVIVGTGDDDTRGTCGNLVAAPGCFAVEEGIVTPVEGLTPVRIRDLNIWQTIVVDVPTVDGRVIEHGPLRMDGVPGVGAPIAVSFVRPGGATTGRTLPLRRIHGR